MTFLDLYAFVIAPLIVLGMAGAGYAYIARLVRQEAEREALAGRPAAPAE